MFLISAYSSLSRGLLGRRWNAISHQCRPRERLTGIGGKTASMDSTGFCLVGFALPVFGMLNLASAGSVVLNIGSGGIHLPDSGGLRDFIGLLLKK